MTPWLVIVLLLGNFLLMAFDARQVNSGQRIIRVWAQTAADFVQSPVTTVTSGITGYFSSISNLRSAQSDNDLLKQRIQELEVEKKGFEDLNAENERLRSQVKQLQERLKVLERIVTDRGIDTAEQIEALRERDRMIEGDEG